MPVILSEAAQAAFAPVILSEGEAEVEGSFRGIVQKYAESAIGYKVV